MEKWVKTTSRLPDTEGRKICFLKDRIEVFSWNTHYQCWDDYEMDDSAGIEVQDVLYWMDFPKIPKAVYHERLMAKYKERLNENKDDELCKWIILNINDKGNFEILTQCGNYFEHIYVDHHKKCFCGKEIIKEKLWNSQNK